MKKEDLAIAIKKDGCEGNFITEDIAEKIWSFLQDRENDVFDGILMMLIGRLKHETGHETAKVLDSWTQQLETA